MLFANQEFDHIKVAFLTSMMKCCSTLLTSAPWVTVLLTDKELDYVQAPCSRCEMKWHILSLISALWVTHFLICEKFHNCYVTI